MGYVCEYIKVRKFLERSKRSNRFSLESRNSKVEQNAAGINKNDARSLPPINPGVVYSSPRTPHHVTFYAGGGPPPAGDLPCIRRTITTIAAITNNRCINPPRVTPPMNPSSQSINKIIKIVQSMVILL
jgi:hypothetical protein